MKKNRFIILFSLLMIVSTLTAQVSIRVQAPSEVIQGDRFRIAYIVNTSDVDDFRIDAFEGLVELYGPSRSQSYFCQLSTTTRAQPRYTSAMGVPHCTQRT